MLERCYRLGITSALMPGSTFAIISSTRIICQTPCALGTTHAKTVPNSSHCEPHRRRIFLGSVSVIYSTTCRVRSRVEHCNLVETSSHRIRMTRHYHLCCTYRIPGDVQHHFARGSARLPAFTYMLRAVISNRPNSCPSEPPRGETLQRETDRQRQTDRGRQTETEEREAFGNPMALPYLEARLMSMFLQTSLSEESSPSTTSEGTGDAAYQH